MEKMNALLCSVTFQRCSAHPWESLGRRRVYKVGHSTSRKICPTSGVSSRNHKRSRQGKTETIISFRGKRTKQNTVALFKSMKDCFIRGEEIVSLCSQWIRKATMGLNCCEEGGCQMILEMFSDGQDCKNTGMNFLQCLHGGRP